MSNGHASKGAEGVVYLVSQCACKRVVGKPVAMAARDMGGNKGASKGWVRVMIDWIALCGTRYTVPRNTEQGGPVLRCIRRWRA